MIHLKTSVAVEERPKRVHKPKVVDVKSVDFAYAQIKREHLILQNINLSLYEHDLVCVLGPSGCGKSSLLNILAGFQQPTTGTVMIHGDKQTKPNPDVGVVFQHPNLFPWLTIEKNIEFGLKMQKVTKEERKQLVANYLQLVDLTSASKKLPHQLSGGMKQRAAIARTLATDPKVILMDEPFSALDALTREAMQQHLLTIWNQTKKCIFFITHDVEEALKLATRIIVMHPKPGRVVLDTQNPLQSGRYEEGTFQYHEKFMELRQFFISKIREQA
ncbi:ABC transporter ATP-binding protein [Priestia megaterium]|nr:ABC transporter ATP-binding protein [Priestia megaterium]MED4101571.1 ABC transporter ATP-binding protein [Priestia megaterium]MED4170149.1 ABC transporter ATP-binding protein [Priestia megaterium]MED4199504.1 ABC transporter ATP-binding protein [Priestia megaterium]